MGRLHGGTGNLGVVSAATSATAPGSGRIGWVSLPGKLSGYSRPGLVYLPPQYSEARYAQVRFPVVELFHGSPGSPLAWSTVLQVSQVADSLLARHLIGPMVLVMPAINGPGHDYQDCVNGPTVNDETYLPRTCAPTSLARYRVSRDPYEWGAAGYSSGGYCAANLALRHPGSFGAAAVIDGYFRAADGPAGAAPEQQPVPGSRQQPAVPGREAHRGSGPVPAFWVAAGANDKADYQPATVFAAAINRVQQVPFVKLNAGDTANAWSGRPAGRPDLAVAAAGPARPAGPVPRARHHPRGHQ